MNHKKNRNENSSGSFLSRYREKISKLQSSKYRWFALIFIALGLGIVIIDGTVLNVSIPYMLRDLHATLSDIQWVISGYSLTIASFLITFGRIGDLWGRKKLFLSGVIVFVIGSLVSSFAPNAIVIIVGRAVIQAFGAAMILTSALSLVATEFQGKDRALAFGIWGSVAGASASVGPLLGGYLTTYYSWRWSLRINVIVGAIVILGSIFIKESKGEGERKFDYLGTVLSSLGLLSLVYSFIEGNKYGFIRPNAVFSVFGLSWPLMNISIISFTFGLAALLLVAFVVWEYIYERRGGSPLLRLSMFKSRRFTLTSAILAILSFGQFSTFFLLPIYLENVLGYDALTTGVVFLSTTISLFIVGIISGFLARRIDLKWIVMAGLIFINGGIFYLIHSIKLDATGLTLAPSLIVFGIGFGLGASQLNNMILSSAPLELAGEASGVSTTMRQIGSSIGVAIIGAILSTSLSGNLRTNITTDKNIPYLFKEGIIPYLQHVDIESGQIVAIASKLLPPFMARSLVEDIRLSVVESTKSAMQVGLYFTFVALLVSIFLPTQTSKKKKQKITEESNGKRKFSEKLKKQTSHKDIFEKGSSPKHKIINIEES